ncbi:MAG: D-alanyl-D-alanine carboxypeptidase [Alphaproteobacteria bacterium]|jgi:D-alanyl-D-alanine carboxypeptidase|nr:D-alanyl-D-alanine carboxypeptidase [Alphaproteobacteria bacterium]
MTYFRLLICLIVFACLNTTLSLTRRYAAIVIDAHSGKVLDEEDADKTCHPASLTKMMTLYMVFEALKSGRITMNTRVPISSHAARQSPSKLGLRPGSSVTVETIIKALTTKSANDCAAAIAEYLGGSESNFASQMTRKARALKMPNTIFKNASGLPNPNQITTARDMATLGRSLYLHFPKDYHHFRLKAFHFRGIVHRNHNHLLNRNGKDAFKIDGFKTGYIAASGFNLAASAVLTGEDNKPRRLITVVLGGPNRHWRDRRVLELFDSNFRRIGIGRGATKVSIAKEDDEDDSEVTEFLKEEREAPKSPLRPIAVSWPPPSSQPSVKKASASDLWAVQMGTYNSREEARHIATKALRILKSGEVSTPKVSKGRKSSYGARLFGISREEATTVCKRYAPKGKECRVLAAN